MKRFKIIKLYNHPFNYEWNVQVWLYNDDLKDFVYSGIGRYCKSYKEVNEYIGEDEF